MPHPNPLRMDRTRTATLRRLFATELRRRYRSLARQVRAYLTGNVNSFLALPDRIAAFTRWLAGTVHQVFFALDWWTSLVKRAYIAGAERSYSEVRRTSASVAGKEEFIRLLMRRRSNGPTLNAARKMPARDVWGQFMSEKVSTLALRLQNELKGATDALSQVIARELVKGYDKGLSAQAIAANIEEVCQGIGTHRALTIANTEVTRMYAAGQLDAMEELGIEGVSREVEWTTGTNACPLCAANAGDILTIDEARDLLPLHPWCACSWTAVPLSDLPRGGR